MESEKLELIEGNNLTIPLDSSFADLVVSDGVCHHTGDTVKAFSECVRILKTDGVLYLAASIYAIQFKTIAWIPLAVDVALGTFLFVNHRTKKLL